MIASSYTLGCWFLSTVYIWIGNPLGRKNSILIGDILVIIGGALQASAWSVAQMIVARVICGFGVGFISCTVPTYMSEMSILKTERGPEVAIQCIYLINGVALAYWLDFGFVQMENQASWRIPIALQSVFALVSLCGIIMLPDTPRWYYAKGRIEEADDVLSRLHGLPLDSAPVQQQRQEILDTIELEKTHARINLMDLFWDRSELRTGKRLRISFLILAIQQNMGINVLVYYSTVILAQIGLSPFMTGLLAAVQNTAFAIGTWGLPSTIERIGRRPILLWSAGACTVAMAIFVAMNGVENKTIATQWTAVAFVIIFVLIFGYGWIGIPWLYGPEIAPLRYRHLGGAFGAFGEWSMTFITVFAGGIALQEVSWAIWFWQLGSCALAVPFVYYLCPETAGKSLEQIDGIFLKHADAAHTPAWMDGPASSGASEKMNVDAKEG